MSDKPVRKLAYWKYLSHRLSGHRFIRFGLVGASGTVINMVVLTLCHEYVFSALEPKGTRPYYSLAVAIVAATLSNFSLNRVWTWAYREQQDASRSVLFIKELGKYATASGFGMVLQYVITMLLSSFMEYRIANLIAIVLASFGNFFANDKWTFRRSKS